MSDCWEQMVEGVLVEVVNTDIDVREVKVYWIATVLRICGTVFHFLTISRIHCFLSSA